MREISLSDVKETVKRLYIEACYEIHDDMLEAFGRAADMEKSPTGKEILQLMIENAALAKQEQLPMCQDTGMAVAFVELGEGVTLDGADLIGAINTGISEACNDGYLRASVVADPPLG